MPRTPTEASGGDLGPSRAERTPDPQAPRESLFMPLWGLWMWELRERRRVRVSERGCQRRPEDMPTRGPGPHVAEGLCRWDRVKAPERG